MNVLTAIRYGDQARSSSARRERPMHTEPTIRRRDNGAIDIDFYRERALMERALASTRFSKVLGRVLRPHIGAAIALGIWMLALPRNTLSVCATALRGGLAAPSHSPDLHTNNPSHQRRSS